ncbi:hypothetical protein EDD92_9518 [Streptomyces sp. TLI_185]|nr:hypothetical protein EDD92_9518 [Streptomyces sp. TLI_185]
MPPVPTRDDDTMTFPRVDAAQIRAEALRRTWPVTLDVQHRVHAGVAGTFDAWGVAAGVADLLGELAAEYVDDVLKLQPSPYIAVTVMIEGNTDVPQLRDSARATVSVIPTRTPDPAQGALLPSRQGAFTESSWGTTTLTTGPCQYATVNVVTVRQGATW